MSIPLPLLTVLVLLAALGQPGLVVAFYNAVLSRLHESAVKKGVALAALPGGWLAALVLLAGLVSGRASDWFLYQGGGAGDALLSAYLFSSAVGGVAILAFVLIHPRRPVRPIGERSSSVRRLALPRRGPWPYGRLKNAFLHLVSPVNQLSDVEVVEKEIELPTLPPGFDGLRLVHLTDFHLDRALEDRYFRDVVEQANRLRPDAIALTGDFVSRGKYIDRLPKLLGGLEAPLGVFYVRGNHDFWTRPEAVRRALDALGYVCLDNRALVLQRDGASDRLALVGIEHPYGEKVRDWGRVFPGDLPACRIALMHTPDAIGPAARAGCDLALAGHTHGGQVQIPVVGAILVPSSYGRRYAHGWRRVGRTLLYVNRGIGAFFPVRFLCPPEITVLTLRTPPIPDGKDTHADGPRTGHVQRP